MDQPIISLTLPKSYIQLEAGPQQGADLDLGDEDSFPPFLYPRIMKSQLTSPLSSCAG
jgi:hypothetical protein